MVTNAIGQATDDQLERAKKRAKELREFYVHLSVYLLVNIGLTVGLFTINWLTAPGDWWFFWPLIGWGVGLLFHGLGVLVFGEGSAIRERMIDQEMKKVER